MENTQEKKISVGQKDLYQFLIAECRYGYTRNNHLMPDGAFRHVKEYLPLMKETDRFFAAGVAEQLADECISALCEGMDHPTAANRLILIQGLSEKGIEPVWPQWRAGICRYTVEFEFNAVPGLKFWANGTDDYLLEFFEKDGRLVAKCHWMDPVHFVRLYAPRPVEPNGDRRYDSLSLGSDDCYEVQPGAEYLAIIEAREQFDVKSYCGFIDYLLDFLKGLNSLRMPYNLSDYEEFLESHPSGAQKAKE